MKNLTSLQEAAKLFSQYCSHLHEEIAIDESGFITARIAINGWIFRVVKTKDETASSELETNQEPPEVAGFIATSDN